MAADREETLDTYYAALMQGADLAANGELPAARAAFERAVKLADTLGDEPAAAEARISLANAVAASGDDAAARPILDEVLARLEAPGRADALLLGMAHFSRAGVRAALDDLAGGTADARAALAHLKSVQAEHPDLLERVRELLEALEAHAG